MFEVDNKFEVGEECWSYYRKNVKIECPVCKGQGYFKYSGYNISCKQCGSTGKIATQQTVTEPCKVKVRRIKVSKWSDVETIKYCVSADWNIPCRNRSENALFKTEEEAKEYCKAVNQKETTPEF